MINVTCPPPLRSPDKIAMLGSLGIVVSVILDKVPVSKVPLFSKKVRVPVLVKSPGLPKTPVNAKGLPDKVKDVAPAKAPVPLSATPLSGPEIVKVRLALPPTKTIEPVVGADKVTPESDALAFIALSAIARVMTAERKIAFRTLDIILDTPREKLRDISPQFLMTGTLAAT